MDAIKPSPGGEGIPIVDWSELDSSYHGSRMIARTLTESGVRWRAGVPIEDQGLLTGVTGFMVCTMEIIVESIGLPALSAVLGKSARVNLEVGASLGDLVDRITQRFGPEARQVLLDSDGKLDLTVQVMLNDEGFISRDDLYGRLLKDGDRVRFMLLVCGG